MSEIAQDPLSWLFAFQLYYPLFMAFVWMIGALYYYYHWEIGKQHHVHNLPALPDTPPVSIVIP